MKDITPERFRCGPTISSCPAIYEEGDSYVIVGADVSRVHAAGSQGETAVKVTREMIDEAVADRLRAREARHREALKQAKETLIFLRSVIDSGERVTLTLEHRYRDTKDKITDALEDKDE